MSLKNNLTFSESLDFIVKIIRFDFKFDFKSVSLLRRGSSLIGKACDLIWKVRAQFDLKIV